MRDMIREEVQDAVVRSGIRPPEGEGTTSKNDAISILTKKMEELQGLVREKKSNTEFNLENMGVKGMKKLPPKFTMPDMQKFNWIRDPKLHLK